MATEKRMISLDEAMEATHKEVWWTESEKAAVRSFLVKLPRADAVEVVHGRWIAVGGNHHTRISQCTNCCVKYDFKSNYCPNCGADMRERE